MRARRAFAAAWLGLAALAPLGSRAQEPPEPSGYRTDRYRSPTPATLKGATVLPVGEAEALWKAGTAVFIDVLPRPPKPAQLPPGTPWRDSPRHSVPGALWLPNVGFGEISPETESYFRSGLEAATKGDLSKPIVLFCQRECWMSWNAAKRALAFGYRRVFWFPDGSDGWSEAGLPLERVEPYAEPKE
ncbi:MAG: PQQ-dependent catabolism-associated CXXCW motif protein [Microvirga sp.]